MARLSRWWRPTWTLSTCLAMLSGPTSALLCTLISLRRRPGLSGSISPTLLPLCPLAVSSPLIAAQSRVTFLAPSRVLSSWETRASRICRISSPLPLSKRASVMSGSLMTGSALFGPCSLIAGCARWTLLWHPSVPPGVALPWEMPRAPLGSSAHPSVSMSSAVGTLLTYVTQLLSLAPMLAPLPLARPLALASKSTPVPGSQCAPVMSCAPPSMVWITHPLNSC